VLERELCLRELKRLFSPLKQRAKM